MRAGEGQRGWKVESESFACDLLFGCRTGVYLALDAARLELVGDGDVVAEQAVARHLPAHHPGQHGSRVNPDAHLCRKTLSISR